MADAAIADTMEFVLGRDETAFARILKAELDGETPEEIAEKLGGRWTVSMVRAYIKGISVIVNGDTSGVTVNEAGHHAGKIRSLLSMNPPPNVDRHLRRVLAELGHDAGSGLIPGIAENRRTRLQEHGTLCPVCGTIHAGEC